MVVSLDSFPVSDAATDQDLLGYDPYAQAMARLLSEPRLETPFIVGIFGPWGTGKTTFMYLLERYAKSVHTAWFQPWQFEEKEEVWKALIYTVLQRLETLDRERFSQAERHNAKLTNLFRGVGKLALSSTISALTKDRADLDTLISFYSDNQRDNAQFINTFRKEFQDTKDEILASSDGEQARLVVFVDDLDRCTPENCITVLEAIKLFFDFEGCIFVLGIDREVVQQGIDLKYGDRLNVRGVDYLEKMVQLPFTLPPVAEATFRHFVELIAGPFQFDRVTVELINSASQENPRRVKRLCNCLFMVSHVAQELVRQSETSLATEGIDQAKLALLLILQVRFPLAYRWLTLNARTFEELSEKWDSVRGELVDSMTDSYGKQVSDQVADEFLSFLRVAHQTVGVPTFADGEELGEYLRITGVVEVRERTAGRSVRNVLDDKMGEVVSKETPTTVPEDEKPPTPPPGEPHSTLKAIEALLVTIVGRWNILWRLNLLALWLRRLLSLEDDLSSLLRSAQRMRAELSMLPTDDKTGWRIRELLSELEPIVPARAIRLVRAAGQSLRMCGLALLIAVAALGSWAYYIAITSDEASAIPWVTPRTLTIAAVILGSAGLIGVLRSYFFLRLSRRIDEEFLKPSLRQEAAGQ